MVLLLVLCAVSAVSSICRVFFFGASVQRNLPGLQPAPPQLHQEVAALRRIHTWTGFIALVLCHYCSYSHVTTVVKIKIYLFMYQIVDKNHKFSSTFLKICNCCSIFPNCMTFFILLYARTIKIIYTIKLGNFETWINISTITSKCEKCYTCIFLYFLCVCFLCARFKLSYGYLCQCIYKCK